MSVSYRPHQLLIPVIVLLLGVIVFAQNIEHQQSSVKAASGDTNCGTGNSLFINNTAVTSSMTIPPGIHHVSVSVPQTLEPSIRSVVFTIDTGILGRGVQVNTNPYWDMQWNSHATAGGQHSIGAKLNLSTGSCVIPAVAVNVSTPTTNSGAMTVRAAPMFFEGYTNEPRNFSLTALSNVGNTALDVTPWTYFDLSTTTLGVISPADGSATFKFSAGPAAGQSSITVQAKYAGNTSITQIPVKIFAQTGSSAAGSTSGTNSGGSTSNSTTAPTKPPIDDKVKACVVSKIGEAKYTAISNKTQQPTAADFEAMRQCFAVGNYVVPSTLVPVQANKDEIKKQPTSDTLVVSKAKTVTTTQNNSKKQNLVFSGKAKPNTTVLVYIFSEPLVVTTQADANGDWSYSLEDPLEPGKHEAYALVSKGDGSYERSSVFSFAVAKAEAAAANPNGLSLNVEPNQATASADTMPVKIYITGISMLVTLVILFIWRRLKRKSKDTDAGSVSIDDSKQTIKSEVKNEQDSKLPENSNTVEPPPSLGESEPTDQNKVAEVVSPDTKPGDPPEKVDPERKP